MSLQRKKQFALRIKHQVLTDSVILDPSQDYILLKRWTAMIFSFFRLRIRVVFFYLKSILFIKWSSFWQCILKAQFGLIFHIIAILTQQILLSFFMMQISEKNLFKWQLLDVVLIKQWRDDPPNNVVSYNKTCPPEFHF